MLFFETFVTIKGIAEMKELKNRPKLMLIYIKLLLWFEMNNELNN